MPKPFAWSYSRLTLHEKCPAQYAGKHVYKTPPGRLYVDDPEFFLKGRRVHGGAAAYLTGAPFYADQDKATYTQDAFFEAKKAQMFVPMLDQLKANMPAVEQQWGFKNDYTPTTWFGNDTYWRVILDVGVMWPDATYTVVDWKTGRPSADNEDQMKQFALAVFSKHRQVNWLETRLEYVDEGKELHGEYRRSEASAMRTDFEKRVGVVKNDQIYVPRPGSHCRHCPFAKSKEGPCAFG